MRGCELLGCWVVADLVSEDMVVGGVMYVGKKHNLWRSILASIEFKGCMDCVGCASIVAVALQHGVVCHAHSRCEYRPPLFSFLIYRSKDSAHSHQITSWLDIFPAVSRIRRGLFAGHFLGLVHFLLISM